MNIIARANNEEFKLHCPCCGKTKFLFMLHFRDGFDDWRRCASCGLDVKIVPDDSGGLIVHAVMEDVKDPESKEEMKYS